MDGFGMVCRSRSLDGSTPAVTLDPCEISWFSALCDDDYEFLGQPDPMLRSSWEHCRNIVTTAEEGGFDNVLLPSGYALGIDTTAFAAAIAPQVRRIKLLMAVRIGEMWPAQLARQIATIDQILGQGIGGGRLNINVISSEMPGETLDGGARYERTTEAIEILRTLLSGQSLDHQGRFWNLKLDGPRMIAPGSKCPPLYFGGLSEPAREVAAKGCDVYLMWPDRMEAVKETIADMRARAAKYGRSLRFGYRVHVIVRETEADARLAADRLLSRLDAAEGAAIRARSLDSQSVGVQAQAALRETASDDGYAEANLWTGIGRARSGCGAAIVGDPDQVLAKLQAYREAGIDAFILSGYPHAREADLFARHVLPRIDHGPLAL
jgi:alkanesulfonate monooxygenase